MNVHELRLQAHKRVLAGIKPGLGTKMQTVIHRALDATPMPKRLRYAIKNCAGCGKRAAAIDRAEAKARKAVESFTNLVHKPENH